MGYSDSLKATTCNFDILLILVAPVDKSGHVTTVKHHKIEHQKLNYLKKNILMLLFNRLTYGSL